MRKFLALLLAFTVLHAADSFAGWDKDIHARDAQGTSSASGSGQGEPKTGK